MLTLQRFKPTDFERLINWIPNQRFMTQWAGPIFNAPLNKRQLNAYLEDTHGEKPTKHIFKTVDSKKKKTIGHIEVGYINYEKKEGVLCRVLIGDPNYRYQGFGLKIVNLALAYAFEKLKLQKVILGVYDFNIPAIKCYKKAGFQPYKIKQNLPVPGNEFWNLICMEVTKKTWQKKPNSKENTQQNLLVETILQYPPCKGSLEDENFLPKAI
jgi:RimJ/RimL family protein N-acetyltransferase